MDRNHLKHRKENKVMTQEEDLLLKYLCMALPYGVMIEGLEHPEVMTIKHLAIISAMPAEPYKPYLHPMTNMTEEEKEEMHNLLSPEGTAIYGCGGISMPMNHYGEFVPYEFMNRIIQYLLKNHFDFMGLIPKDLAIEVTENNNPYKE